MWCRLTPTDFKFTIIRLYTMNFKDNNQKQIDKLARMEQLYKDAEKHESVMDKIEAEEEEDICAFPRKIFKTILILTWAACIGALMVGVDVSLVLCAMLFTLGIFLGLSVTKFLKKDKLGDAIISAVVAIAVIALSVLLLTNDTH